MYLTSHINRPPTIPLNKNKGADGDRSLLAKQVIGLLALLLLAVIVLGLAIGPSSVSLQAVVSFLYLPFGETALADRDQLILQSIRLPRVLMGALVGAALAVSGAVMQGLFRNPLADPGIVGVSSGAGLGAITIIVLGTTVFAPVLATLGIFALPVAAFLGALVTTLLLFRLATKSGQTSIATLLLGGIAIAAFAGALTGLLVFLADDQQLRDLTFWGLGSLAGATWLKLISIAPIILTALLVAPFLARGLNALALGEATAHHVGVPVQRLKYIAIISVAAATGAAVAVSGGIGFVGIVVPHLLRLLIGPDNRYLLPASAILGATLLIGCDIISRTIVAPAELPIGVVTALIGAPFFLWILLSRRSFLGGER